jgi:hypothetical protein
LELFHKPQITTGEEIHAEARRRGELRTFNNNVNKNIILLISSIIHPGAVIRYGVLMSDEKSTGENRIPWHPAFFEAIQMELEDYSNLQLVSEYQLNTKPLRIDVVIIKKPGDALIKKNIAAIFRKENIVEYKSPDDYVSVDDFYMVYGYACLYVALNKAKINELTLTFVESRYPKKLLAHLQKVRGYSVEEKQSGIYNINGDILPIQIIIIA